MQLLRMFGDNETDAHAAEEASSATATASPAARETAVTLHSGGNSRTLTLSQRHLVDRSSRVDARIDVQLWINSEVVDPEARTANVSEDGMFVATMHPLPVGTVSRFHMVLPTGEEVAGFAEVVWIRPCFESAERPNGMGMRYAAVRENGTEILRSFVLANLPITPNAVARIREQDL